MNLRQKSGEKKENIHTTVLQLGLCDKDSKIKGCQRSGTRKNLKRAMVLYEIYEKSKKPLPPNRLCPML